MQRLQFSIKGRTLVVFDRVNGGSLHISFNRKGKFEISPTFEAWNDLEVAINSGELDLILLGYSTIREYDGFILKGKVTLSSCHLFDPHIENSELHMVSMKPRTRIKDSILSFIGIPHFGTALFTECNLDALPKRVSFRYISYYRNQPI